MGTARRSVAPRFGKAYLAGGIDILGKAHESRSSGKPCSAYTTVDVCGRNPCSTLEHKFFIMNAESQAVVPLPPWALYFVGILAAGVYAISEISDHAPFDVLSVLAVCTCFSRCPPGCPRP